MSRKRKKKSLGVEIIVDDKDAEKIATWSKGGFDKAFGEGYCYHTKGTGSNGVKFTAKLPQAGQSEVYEWHPARLNRAENAPFTVLHARGTNRVTINQKLNGARWNLLGTFPFQADAEVRVSDEDLKGNVVIADAVKLVLVSTNDLNGDELIAVQDEAGNTQWEQIKAKQEEVSLPPKKQFNWRWHFITPPNEWCLGCRLNLHLMFPHFLAGTIQFEKMKHRKARLVYGNKSFSEASTGGGPNGAPED